MNAAIVLVVFDVTDPLSWTRTQLWVAELMAAISPHALLVLLGNKGMPRNRLSAVPAGCH
jgi:hypothetical protein